MPVLWRGHIPRLDIGELRPRSGPEVQHSKPGQQPQEASLRERLLPLVQLALAGANGSVAAEVVDGGVDGAIGEYAAPKEALAGGRGAQGQ